MATSSKAKEVVVFTRISFREASFVAPWRGNFAPEMQAARNLWALVQGNPVFMRRVNGFLTLFWMAMIPISYALGWLSSVTYVSALSLWALVSGHWSTWQAARVEVTQQKEIDEAAKHPVEEKVVERLVDETTVDRTN